MEIAINDLKLHTLSIKKEIEDAIFRVVDSGWFVLGPELKAFEKEFAAYLGCMHTVAVGNGSDALELALRALDVKSGDQVVTVANAGMYSTTAIMAVGAVPIYVDIDENSLLMTLSSLERVECNRVSAIIVTHIYGQMVDMPNIMKVSKQYNLPVIEDCAQAHGARMHGRYAGTWGKIGSFSFYPTKNLGALGDGGALVTSDEHISSRLRMLRQYGWGEKYETEIMGGRNSRLDEIQAAVLRVKLHYLEQWNERRREIARQYVHQIQHPIISKPFFLGESFVSHLFVIRTDARDKLKSYLMEHGIMTDIHYPIPDYKQPALKNRFSNVYLEKTEKACLEVLTLPCFPEMSDADVLHIINTINTWRY